MAQVLEGEVARLQEVQQEVGLVEGLELALQVVLHQHPHLPLDESPLAVQGLMWAKMGVKALL